MPFGHPPEPIVEFYWRTQLQGYLAFNHLWLIPESSGTVAPENIGTLFPLCVTAFVDEAVRPLSSGLGVIVTGMRLYLDGDLYHQTELTPHPGETDGDPLPNQDTACIQLDVDGPPVHPIRRGKINLSGCAEQLVTGNVWDTDMTTGIATFLTNLYAPIVDGAQSWDPAIYSPKDDAAYPIRYATLNSTPRVLRQRRPAGI